MLTVHAHNSASQPELNPLATILLSVLSFSSVAESRRIFLLRPITASVYCVRSLRPFTASVYCIRLLRNFRR